MNWPLHEYQIDIAAYTHSYNHDLFGCVDICHEFWGDPLIRTMLLKKRFEIHDHKHRLSCFKKDCECRFLFPFYPQEKTHIDEDESKGHRVALKPFFVYALAVRALRKQCLDVVFCLLDVGIASVIIRQVQMTGIKKLIWKLYRFFSCYRGPAFLTFLKVIIRVLSVEYFETSPTKVSMTLVTGHFVATVKLLNRRGT